MPTTKACIEFINSQKINSLSFDWKQTYQGKGLRSFSNPQGQTVTLMQKGSELSLYRLDMHAPEISHRVKPVSQTKPKKIIPTVKAVQEIQQLEHVQSLVSRGEMQLCAPAQPEDALEFIAQCTKDDIRVIERPGFYYFPGDENTPVTKLRDKASIASAWKIMESWGIEDMDDFWGRYTSKNMRGGRIGQNLFYCGEDLYPMMVVKEGLAQVFLVALNSQYEYLVYVSHDHVLMLGLNQKA